MRMKNLYLTILGVILSVGLMAQTATTISAVQGTGAASPFDGDSVIVSGLVTAVDTNYNDVKGYVIQDGNGPRSGIYVFDSDNQPLVGDSIRVQATVKEHFNFTELTFVKNYIVFSSGHTVIPEVITIAQANSEDYESVLVTVKNLTCMSTPTNGTYGTWTTTNGSVELKIDDFLSSMYVQNPTLSETYDITGVIDWNEWGSYNGTEEFYQVNPRYASDIVVSTSIEGNVIGDTKIFPIPASDKINVTSKENINSIELFNVIGKSVYTETFKSTSKISLDVNNFKTGMYMLKVNYDNSSSVYRVVVK